MNQENLNSRLADSSVARNTFVGYSIPIKIWICPGFIFYKYFKTSSRCNALSLSKFCVITKKGKKRNKKKKKRKKVTFEIIFLLLNVEFAVCFRQFALNDVRVYKKYLYSLLLLLSRFLSTIIKCQNQLRVMQHLGWLYVRDLHFCIFPFWSICSLLFS